ncbi:MAG TPA: TonB C-terminal domain-containing protein [Verrucomicrobiae bacterium]|jgi:hypothetical protein
MIISFTFHALLVLVLAYFAAREGLIGQAAKKIAVQLIKQPPKPKPPAPKPPPVVVPKVAAAPKMAPPKVAAPPTMAPPTVAPPPTTLPSMVFGGGRDVISSSDPVQLYKGEIENAMLSRWDRPEDIDDGSFVAEVQVMVAQDGALSHPVWETGSGNKRWDDSVRQVLAAVTKMDGPPPTNFPPRITIKFDVQDAAQSLFQ